MAAVTICFSTNPKSLVSRIIRLFTKSRCSHSFFTVEAQTFGTLIVESDTGGVQVTTAARFNFTKNVVVQRFSTHTDLLPALRAQMDVELGEGYDYPGLVGMAVVTLLRWLKVKIHNPLHAPKHLFCSAFVVTVLQQAQFPGADALVPEDTSPQMLWDFLAASDPALFAA